MLNGFLKVRTILLKCIRKAGHCGVILNRGMGSKVADTCGHYFVGNRFDALQCKTIHYFVKHSGGGTFVGKVPHEIHNNYDNFTVRNVNIK